MVKRKAAISIDEWLLSGITDPETNYPTATTSTDRHTEPNYAPSVVVQSVATGEHVAGPLATGGRAVQSARRVDRWLARWQPVDGWPKRR